MSELTKKYLDLITSEYAKNPKFNSYVESFLLKIEDVYSCLETFNEKFNLENAVGDQLDILGNIVGISRILPVDNPDIPKVLDDETFRTIIKAKILKNKWDGTFEGLQKLIQLVFPNSNVQIQDNQDMSCYVNIYANDIDPDKVLALLQNGYLFPKPSGVKITYAIYDRPFFGFEEDENDPPEWLGWDISLWAPY